MWKPFKCEELLRCNLLLLQFIYYIIYNWYVIYNYVTLYNNKGFPGTSNGKSICLQCRRPGFNPWVWKIPWRRNWQPTPVLLPRKSHGWRSLAGYSQWGHKESDTTEWLTLITIHVEYILNIFPFFRITAMHCPQHVDKMQPVYNWTHWGDSSHTMRLMQRPISQLKQLPSSELEVLRTQDQMSCFCHTA